MKTYFAIAVMALLVAGCASTPPPEAPPAKAPAVLDYGDHTSQTLTTNAWLALEDGNYPHAVKYAEKCAELYEAEARQMQASLSKKAPYDKVHDYWALNDVGTSYFIKGEALSRSGKNKDALAAYRKVYEEFSYAQAWDPKGWFWSPADAAYPKIQLLSEDF